MFPSLFRRKPKQCSTPEEIRDAFGEWLLRKGYCDAEAWEAVLAVSGEGGVLENAIYAASFRDTEAARVLARLSGLPYASPGAVRRRAWQQMLGPLQEEFQRWHAVPLEPQSTQWPIAIADPTDAATRAEIAARLGENVTFVVAPYHAIRAALTPSLAEGAQALRDLADLAPVESLEDLLDPDALDSGTDSPPPADAPVPVRFAHALLDTAVAERASALLLEVVEGELRARLRIDGGLHDLVRVPRGTAQAVLNRLETLARITPGNRSQPAEGGFTFLHDRRRVPVVVDSVPAWGGRTLTARLYPPLPADPLADLGFAKPDRERLDGLLDHPQGLFLVVGPTGSGRTRLLYSLAQQINSVQRDLLVLDRARRYELPGTTAPACRSEADVEEFLGQALRGGTEVVLLREAPPPRMLWDLLQAASEGTAVLLRVPGRDAAAGIERLCRESGRAELVSRALSVAIGCRLLPRPCPDCAGSAPGAGAEPCATCRDRGTAGQVGLKEVLLPDAALQRAIASDAPASRIRDAAPAAGMTPLAEHLRLAAEAGTVSQEAAQRALAYR